MLGLALVLAIGAVFVAVRWINQRANGNTAKVAVAMVDVSLGSRLTDGDKANIVLKDVYGCLAGAAAALLAGQPQFVPLAVLFTAGGMSASALGDALAAKK